MKSFVDLSIIMVDFLNPTASNTPRRRFSYFWRELEMNGITSAGNPGGYSAPERDAAGRDALFP